MRDQHKMVKLDKYYIIVFLALLLIVPSTIFIITRKPAKVVVENAHNHDVAIALTTNLPATGEFGTSGTGYIMNKLVEVSETLNLTAAKKELVKIIPSAQQLELERNIGTKTLEKISKLLETIDKKQNKMNSKEANGYIDDLNKLIKAGKEEVKENNEREIQTGRINATLSLMKALASKKDTPADVKLDLNTLLKKAQEKMADTKTNAKDMKNLADELEKAYQEANTKAAKEIKETADKESKELAKKVASDTTWFKTLSVEQKEAIAQNHLATKDSDNSINSTYGKHGLIIGLSDGHYICISGADEDLLYPYVTAKNIKAVYSNTGDAEKAGYKNITKLSNKKLRKLIDSAKAEYNGPESSTDSSSSEEQE
jgi:polyhydroxyalkanoate synthesis regulator phasin